MLLCEEGSLALLSSDVHCQRIALLAKSIKWRCNPATEFIQPDVWHTHIWRTWPEGLFLRNLLYHLLPHITLTRTFYSSALPNSLHLSSGSWRNKIACCSSPFTSAIQNNKPRDLVWWLLFLFKFCQILKKHGRGYINPSRHVAMVNKFLRVRLIIFDLQNVTCFTSQFWRLLLWSGC